MSQKMHKDITLYSTEGFRRQRDKMHHFRSCHRKFYIPTFASTVFRIYRQNDLAFALGGLSKENEENYTFLVYYTVNGDMLDHEEVSRGRDKEEE